MQASDADVTSTLPPGGRVDPRSRPAGARAGGLTRRAALLLPLLLAACGGEEPHYFPPLRYGYLPPIRLNVSSIQIEQRFIPSGMPPDVTQFDPVTLSDALRAMAQDRLQAFGTTGRAVFVIQDASLVRQGDTISGSMDVVLDIYPADGAPRAGFAEARVTRQFSGHIDDLRAKLYEMTKAMMDAMNVEFEYQIRNRLHDWLASGTAPVPAVQAQPLDGSPPPGASPSSPPPDMGAPPIGAPQIGAPPMGAPPMPSPPQPLMRPR